MNANPYSFSIMIDDMKHMARTDDYTEQFSHAIDTQDAEEYIETLQKTEIALGTEDEEQIIRERLTGLGQLAALIGLEYINPDREQGYVRVTEQVVATSALLEDALDKGLISRDVWIALEAIIGDIGYTFRSHAGIDGFRDGMKKIY